MKMKAIILAVLAVFLLGVGCSRPMTEEIAMSADSVYTNVMSDGESMSYGESGSSYRSKLSNDQFDPSVSDSVNINDLERKLVKTADISIRVENLEAAESKITALLEKFNGYSASVNSGENYRYYSLRIPSRYYDVFLAEMNGMGRLINRYENTEDVTIRYYDLEGRLESKKELLQTFQTYLRRAANMEDILAVEARIAELQYDIEFTGTQLRDLSNRVDYATISLNLSGPVSSPQNQDMTFGERIKLMFSGFGGFLSSAAVFLIGLVIYGIPLLLLMAFLFWLLFGKIGLLKKLWRLVMVKKQG